MKERVYNIYIYRESMYGENRHCKVIEDGSGANRIYALKYQVYNVNYKLRWYREIDSSLCGRVYFYF